MSAVANAGRVAKSGHAGPLLNAREGSPTSIEAPTQSQRDGEVLQLARSLTSQSAAAHGQSPFGHADGGPLDPDSDKFSAQRWAKAFYSARYCSDDVPSSRAAGVSFKNLSVGGIGTPTDFQSSVGNSILKLPALFGRGQRKVAILHNMEGLVLPGEQLCVLGPPGSGCTTLLKTIAGETHGVVVDPAAEINYHGVTAKDMATKYRGEAIYTAEVDNHFPELTVGDTLYFAALARTPRQLPSGISRHDYAAHLRDVTMALFGISHTRNTRVGNDFVRGVSGGERKRVTIAEAALSYAPLQCWDNSTRGLDSANAVEFCRTLRTQCDVFGSTAFVAIYQSPEAAYKLFDKVTVLYEGRQIYFGRADEARAYFEGLGFECPKSQTTPDFLTSMTSPAERRVKPGYEDRVPRTSDDFARCWHESPERQQLLLDIESYNAQYPSNGPQAEHFALVRKAEKSTFQREVSPYTLSYWGQVKLCMWREILKLKNDPSIIIVILMNNTFEALILASIFFNLSPTTSSFYYRGAVIFMMVLLNGFGCMIEIMSLYAKRKIVEKHSRYALYHPSAESLASMIVDLPNKVLNAVAMNLILYFMANLRREPGPFFFFFLVSFTMTLAMSAFFRFFASITKTISQALAPASVVLLILALYTGFVLPVDYMRGWISWIRWLNPIAYGFESTMINEFNGREFACSSFVPSGPSYVDILPSQRACTEKGAVLGEPFVRGSNYIETAFSYSISNKWRNFGIIVAMTFALYALQLWMSEVVASERSKGEVLVFRRRKMPADHAPDTTADEEKGNPHLTTSSESSEVDASSMIQKSSSIFHWEDVCYQVKIKDETRVILDHVDGWIKPGTLTALMGVSGAGKTTLLDVLASRTTVGVVSGSMLVDGQERDGSFQRKTGYVQQQDLHLPTSTVREALEFSAILRQPAEYSMPDRIRYVDHVIDLLGMGPYANAVVGTPGEGLNVEQRKRLTIGVELAARPKLLLFLDEPTSGLDSQTSWNICDLMEKLTQSGQAILCTIHQPSAMLFQRFDRLLLLAKGGKTVYFGPIGQNSRVLLEYLQRNGGPACPPGVNPAEHMLEVIGAAPGARSEIDWPATWRSSEEYRAMKDELARLHSLQKHASETTNTDPSGYDQFAAPMTTQFLQVGKRAFQQYWRSPSYIYSKVLLCVFNSLFIGFSFFKEENTIQGLQNQMFGVFIFLFIVIMMVTQVMPVFVQQRTMYEARERQSRTYAWQAFVASNIVVELFWNTIMAVFAFFVWYYPIGLYRNANFTDTVASRGFLTFLNLETSFLFASSFGHMLIAGVGSEEVASSIATLLGIMLYAFCGILSGGPGGLPGFWIFMYRVNPFTYLASSLLSATLGAAPVQCGEEEFQRFLPPSGQTCGAYMQDYINDFGGYMRDPSAQGNESCEYCRMENTNDFLAGVGIDYADRWGDWGILCCYVVVNCTMAFVLYWLARVPKTKRKQRQV